MKERWAEMPKVYSVEERGKSLMIGQRRWDIPLFVLDQDGIDRIRLGYVCVACLECHERPYPERCKAEHCQFPIRKYQDEVFAHLYVGEMDVGPSTSLEEEWEWAVEEVQRQRHQPGSSIWIPRTVGPLH